MERQRSNEAVVMVHPFDSEEYETQQDYLDERNELIRDPETNLFILTNNPDETRRRLEGRAAGIISTREANPKPLMGWKLLSNILVPYSELAFCGAELHLTKENKPYTGCVLDAFRKITHSNKYIYFAGCWIGD